MLTVHGLVKRYGALTVLNHVDLRVAEGEVVALLGSSGAGKTTLLQLIGTLDRPDAGGITFGGTDLLRMTSQALAAFRNQNLGFVFQFHHLLDEFTALENAAMPGYIAGLGRAEAERRATALLERLGLAQRLDHRPRELSGGEQQRVAVARALVNRPRLILADEPTGNLDITNAQSLFELFLSLAREHGVAFVVATHHEAFGAQADRVVRLSQGRVVSD